MSQDKALCDEFTTNFNEPERQVDILGRSALGGDADEGPDASRGLEEDAVHERSLVSSPARRLRHRPGDPKCGRKA